MAKEEERPVPEEPSEDTPATNPEVTAKGLAGKLAPKGTRRETAEDDDEEPPVVKLANFIIARGVFEKASDIYIYPNREGTVLVRIRLDDIVVDGLIVPQKAWQSLRQRLLVMADLDFVWRKPQVGTIRLLVEGNPYTFRLTTVPSHHADHLCIRPYFLSLPLSPPEELGLTANLLALLDSCLRRPGLTVLTGPPGVGCTTTAYALLRRAERETRYLAVYEDSESYPSFGAVTVYHNLLQSVPLRDTVSAFLKQCADLIFLGNLEDTESILVAMEAAERGIPVLAIFQAQDANHVLDRLRWKGIPTDRLHRTLTAVVSQRLLRRLCETCKEPGETEGTFRAKGCDQCRGTGYRGRFGVFEALASGDTFGEKVWQLQTLPLRDIARSQIRAGRTTAEEVNRVLPTL